MNLMREIRDFAVPKKSVALWWLGQNGYIFKTPEGTLLSTDLYLTNCCAEIYRDIGIDLNRQTPVLISPDELEVDFYTCTHSHCDHADPEAIHALRDRDTMQFIGPQATCEVFRAQGVETGRITAAWPACDMEFRDIRLHGTFALPTDDTDLNHMGYVFEFGGGPRVYMTGDTDYSELLASARRHSPDLMITCINGGFNNLSHWEAAEVARQIQPRAAIPCHYDMFPDNAADPQQFRAALKLRAPEVRYQQLEHGKAFVFSIG